MSIRNLLAIIILQEIPLLPQRQDVPISLHNRCSGFDDRLPRNRTALSLGNVGSKIGEWIARIVDLGEVSSCEGFGLLLNLILN